jgi:EAL domain-containing protein (putative c-di-GMP-specific phosphodiesterase class I)
MQGEGVSDPDSTAPSASASDAALGPARNMHAVQPQRELRIALQDDQLSLLYQPIVRLDTFEITSVEALLRWQHPDGGFLTPDDFLPSVVQTPIMREITRHVLDLACREMAHLPTWSLSVNVAASDVVHPDFARTVIAVLDATGLDPARLTLELTEQSMVQDIAQATEHLQRLREIGVGIALDDFGTGYSSLLYLRALPITQVKIDQLFVATLDDGNDEAAIIESVVRLAHTIDVDVVAEGVETPEQALFLQSVGCLSAQGYLFGRPCEAGQLSSSTTSDWIGPPPSKPVRQRLTRRPAVDPTTMQHIQSLLSEGASLHTVAAALNRGGTTTPQGSRWSAAAVARVVATLPDPSE